MHFAPKALLIYQIIINIYAAVIPANAVPHPNSKTTLPFTMF